MQFLSFKCWLSLEAVFLFTLQCIYIVEFYSLTRVYSFYLGEGAVRCQSGKNLVVLKAELATLITHWHIYYTEGFMGQHSDFTWCWPKLSKCVYTVIFFWLLSNGSCYSGSSVFYLNSVIEMIENINNTLLTVSQGSFSQTVIFRT